TLVELVMGQLQRLLLRHSRDRELIGKLSEVFQSIQEEKYSEAAGKLNKTPVSRKVKADQGPEFNNATTLLQLLEQGLARRQVTPAAAESARSSSGSGGSPRAPREASQETSHRLPTASHCISPCVRGRST